MKTNHQRGFKDTRDSRSVYNDYIVFSETRRLPISGKILVVSVTCGDHINAKRGIAKDRRGAKKFVNSRTRFHEDSMLRRQVKELNL